jgi:hypothetical protein
MHPRRWAPHGKLAASPAALSRSRPMGPSIAQPSRSFVSRSSAEKSMGVYAWCMRPASAVVVPVRCVNSANGMGVLLQSRARSACCCTRFTLAPHHCSGEIGAAANIGVPVENSYGTNAFCVSLSPPATARPPTADVVLSRAQRAHSRLGFQERLARNARSQACGHVTITLFGLPAGFAASLGFVTA